MGFNPKQLQDTAQRIQERVRQCAGKAADNSVPLRRVVNCAVLPAVVRGVTVARSEPGSQSKRHASKATKAAGLVALGATVAYYPVRGGIHAASHVVGALLVKRVHNGVTSKPGRFLLTAIILTGVGVTREKLLDWAAEQPRLKKLEEQGLGARLQARRKQSTIDLDEVFASVRDLGQDPKAFASDLEEMLDLLKRRRPQLDNS